MSDTRLCPTCEREIKHGSLQTAFAVDAHARHLAHEKLNLDGTPHSCRDTFERLRGDLAIADTANSELMKAFGEIDAARLAAVDALKQIVDLSEGHDPVLEVEIAMNALDSQPEAKEADDAHD